MVSPWPVNGHDRMSLRWAFERGRSSRTGILTAHGSVCQGMNRSLMVRTLTGLRRRVVGHILGTSLARM